MISLKRAFLICEMNGMSYICWLHIFSPFLCRVGSTLFIYDL
jgi:hypothetical protein